VAQGDAIVPGDRTHLGITTATRQVIGASGVDPVQQVRHAGKLIVGVCPSSAVSCEEIIYRNLTISISTPLKPEPPKSDLSTEINRYALHNTSNQHTDKRGISKTICKTTC